MTVATQSVTFAQLSGKFKRVGVEEARLMSREVGSLILWRPHNLPEEEQFCEVRG